MSKSNRDGLRRARTSAKPSSAGSSNALGGRPSSRWPPLPDEEEEDEEGPALTAGVSGGSAGGAGTNGGTRAGRFGEGTDVAAGRCREDPRTIRAGTGVCLAVGATVGEAGVAAGTWPGTEPPMAGDWLGTLGAMPSFGTTGWPWRTEPNGATGNVGPAGAGTLGTRGDSSPATPVRDLTGLPPSMPDPGVGVAALAGRASRAETTIPMPSPTRHPSTRTKVLRDATVRPHCSEPP